MKTIINEIIQEVYSDLEACGELDAEMLADTVGDRLSDTSEEYRAMPYETRRAMVLSVCQNYC